MKIERGVALFTRAWIETAITADAGTERNVALFTRAWIETDFSCAPFTDVQCRPLHEGVD